MAGQVRRPSKGNGVGRQRLEMPEALGSQGRFQSKNGICQGRRAWDPEVGPTWQSIMASSSFSSIFFSPVSAHRRASRTGPSGRPPSFFRGASQSGDKAMGRGGSSGKLSLEASSNCPGGGTMCTEGEKRLSHAQAAANLKTQLHLLRRTLRPWRRHSQTLRISRTHSGGDTARPLYIPRHMEETPARPSLTPGQIWKDTDSQRGYTWACTGEIQII